jgi:hypothetical protein
VRMLFPPPTGPAFTLANDSEQFRSAPKDLPCALR